MSEFIYEVRDSTDDEMFYVLGLYKNAEEAIKEIKKEALKNSPISDYQEEFEEVSVYQRGFGWGDSDKVIFSIYREQALDEGLGKWFWQVSRISDKTVPGFKSDGKNPN